MTGSSPAIRAFQTFSKVSVLVYLPWNRTIEKTFQNACHALPLRGKLHYRRAQNRKCYVQPWVGTLGEGGNTFQTFSKVSVLVYLPWNRTIEKTFQNACQLAVAGTA